MKRSIILAAGQGKRLRPLTNHVPKCLVPLLDVPLLHRQIHILQQCKITDISLVTGYLAQTLRHKNFKTYLNRKYQSSNMVASLFCAAELFSGDFDLIISYGDIVYQVDVLQQLLETKSPINLVVDKAWQSYWQTRMSDPLNDVETLKLDGEGNVTELGKKPTSYAEIQGQYIGLFKVSHDYARAFYQAYLNMDRQLTYDGQSFENMYMTSFLQHLIDQGWQVESVPIHSGWLEVDSVSDLELYERLYLENKLQRFCSLGENE